MIARTTVANGGAPTGASSVVFDYELQVWVRDGIVQPCGHPESMRQRGPCCNAARLAGAAVLANHGAWAADMRAELEALISAAAIAPSVRIYVTAGMNAARAAIRTAARVSA